MAGVDDAPGFCREDAAEGAGRRKETGGGAREELQGAEGFSGAEGLAGTGEVEVDLFEAEIGGEAFCAVAAGDWAKNTTAESRDTLQDIYHEAKAERDATTHGARA